MSYLIPLGLGLAGGLHCVGMCGPILLAVIPDGPTRRKMAMDALLYHSGRILTYAAMGAFFGVIGKGLVLAGIQQILSVIMGGIFIVMAFFAFNLERYVLASGILNRFNQQLKKQMSRLLHRKGKGALVGLGLLNGLLPCGMVYAAIAGAISTTSGWEGAVFMFLFGLGTLPLLLLLTLAGKSIRPVWRQYLRRAQPMLFLMVGLLCIMRGMKLDLSLFESAVPASGVMCH